MDEGEDVGPGGMTQSSTDSGKFYYNSYIDKFVVWYNVGGSSTGWRWTTFDPTKDTGLQYGNPTASRFLTTSTQWTTNNLTNSQYTISGSSNTVVLASDKINDAGGTPKMIECIQNSGLINGFYSTCGYKEYTHEVTLGSTASDDDNIGIMLAAIKDDEGLYGPSGQTHTIQLHFVGRQLGSASLRYNNNNNVQAFNDGTQVSTLIWNGNTPFGPGYYNNRGYVRVKVIKTGTTLSILTTQTMGTQSGAVVGPGGTNPYSLLVSIDLTDSSTWTDAPAYATGNELEKFTGATQFGYLTSSQPATQFFDIVFSGTQQTNNDVIYGLNVNNPGANNVSTFNEIPGCWEYVEDVTGYTGPSYSLTLDTGYPLCTQCPTDNQPLPSSTPSPTQTPTPTPTPTGTPLVSPTNTPTPTPTLPPSGPNQIFVSGGVFTCENFCGIPYTVNTPLTCDGPPLTPTFIYGIQNGIENGYYAYWNTSSNTGPSGQFYIAQLATAGSGPNTGLFGEVLALYQCGGNPTQCLPL